MMSDGMCMNCNCVECRCDDDNQKDEETMPKGKSIQVDMDGNKIAGYQFGCYWLGCNGRTISGMCGDSFKSEGELLASYDNCFGQSGSAGGIVRVYEDGTKTVLRCDPMEIKKDVDNATDR